MRRDEALGMLFPKYATTSSEEMLWMPHRIFSDKLAATLQLITVAIF